MECPYCGAADWPLNADCDLSKHPRIEFRNVEPMEYVVDPVTGEFPPCRVKMVSREELLKEYPPAKK